MSATTWIKGARYGLFSISDHVFVHLLNHHYTSLSTETKKHVTKGGPHKRTALTHYFAFKYEIPIDPVPVCAPRSGASVSTLIGIVSPSCFFHSSASSGTFPWKIETS